MAEFPARAAEITEVADAADGDDPFDFELEAGWWRELKQSKIIRENMQTNPSTGLIETVDVTELRYEQVHSELQLMARAGLYKDLELHLQLPVVLAHTQSWRSASLAGLPENSTIHNKDGLCSNGDVSATCVGDLFDFNGDTGNNKSYRAGFGDGTLGIAWGILNNERDPADATWVLGIDWTFPSATKRNLLTVPSDSANPGSLGDKTNYFNFRTALSKNLEYLDPFVEFHYRYASPQKPHAWHNCERAADLADMDRSVAGVQNTCTAGKEWIRDGNNRGGFQPPHVGGVSFGAELLPYVDLERFVRVAFQLSFTADYVSEGRYFNELSDALQKTLYTQEFLRMTGTFGVRVQASRYAKFHLLGSFGTETAHLLTGESIGKDLDGTGLVELTTDRVNEEQNPNYDFRYDQPGRRFRVEETTLFSIYLTGEVNF